MPTPEELERQVTLRTAVARYEELRLRDSLADPDVPPDAGHAATPLSREEALELLTLGEVIARKAGYGRQLAVRSARTAGASWTQIGAALGTSKQTAWEVHNRWIDQQTHNHGSGGHPGAGEDRAAEHRAPAESNADTGT